MVKNISHGSGNYGVVIKWHEGGTTTYWYKTPEDQNKGFKKTKTGLSKDHTVSKTDRS